MKINKLVILPLLILVVLVVGTSYAFYTKTSDTNRKISLTTGNKYVGVYGDNKDSIELNKDYTFTIENRGTVDAGYELYLESTTDLDLSKINYTISGDVTKTGTLSDNISNTGNIATGQTITITLRLELDSAELARINSENETRSANNQELISLDFNSKIKVNTINPTYLKDVVSVGDIVKMTPTQTTYTITADLLGGNSSKTINPSYMRYWRIININFDGTMEAVAEYIQKDTSEKFIYFSGATGYQKYVGTLNTIAAQYYNDTYTVSTHSKLYFREFGYNGQTEILSSTPTLENSGTTPTPALTAGTLGQEYNGGYGGDTLYARDIKLLGIAKGLTAADGKPDTADERKTLIAYALDASGNVTTRAAMYWIGSRGYDHYTSGNSSYYSWCIHNIISQGYIGNNGLFKSDGSANSFGSALRPVITLKSDIFKPSGDGQSIETAWDLK